MYNLKTLSYSPNNFLFIYVYFNKNIEFLFKLFLQYFTFFKIYLNSYFFFFKSNSLRIKLKKNNKKLYFHKSFNLKIKTFFFLKNYKKINTFYKSSKLKKNNLLPFSPFYFFKMLTFLKKNSIKFVGSFFFKHYHKFFFSIEKLKFHPLFTPKNKLKLWKLKKIFYFLKKNITNFSSFNFYFLFKKIFFSFFFSQNVYSNKFYWNKLKIKSLLAFIPDFNDLFFSPAIDYLFVKKKINNKFIKNILKVRKSHFKKNQKRRKKKFFLWRKYKINFFNFRFSLIFFQKNRINFSTNFFHNLSTVKETKNSSYIFNFFQKYNFNKKKKKLYFISYRKKFKKSKTFKLRKRPHKKILAPFYKKYKKNYLYLTFKNFKYTKKNFNFFFKSSFNTFFKKKFKFTKINFFFKYFLKKNIKKRNLLYKKLFFTKKKFSLLLKRKNLQNQKYLNFRKIFFLLKRKKRKLKLFFKISFKLFLKRKKKTIKKKKFFKKLFFFKSPFKLKNVYNIKNLGYFYTSFFKIFFYIFTPTFSLKIKKSFLTLFTTNVKINLFSTFELKSKIKFPFNHNLCGFLYLDNLNEFFFLQKNNSWHLRKLLYNFSSKNEIQNFILKKYVKFDFIPIFHNYKTKKLLQERSSFVNSLKTTYNYIDWNIEKDFKYSSDFYFTNFENYQNLIFFNFLTNKNYFNKNSLYSSQLSSINWSKFNSESSYFKYFHEKNDDIIIKKTKFKPGYSIMWRDYRLTFKNYLNLKFRYQHQLTKYLLKFNKVLKNRLYFLFEMRLENVLTLSKFLPDKSWSTFFINEGLVFINGIKNYNISEQLFKNDFVQLHVSLKYYILYRWLTHWQALKKIKFRKQLKRKLNAKELPEDKQRSKNLPLWLLNHKNLNEDVAKYIEVDYFSLSFFIIYEPYFFTDLNALSFYGTKFNIINLFNWKYIN